MVADQAGRKILLVRHGNTFEANEPARFIGSRGDPGLTEAGRQQASRIGQVLSQINFIPQIVMCGPRLRQSETAEIICGSLPSTDRLAPTKEPRFEEIDYGLWEGLTSEEIASKWSTELVEWQKRDLWPSAIFGSSKSVLMAGLNDWLALVSEDDYPFNRIVAVTSNGTLRLLHEILGVSELSPNSKVRTGNICGISITENKQKVLFWNKEPEISLQRYL